MGNKASQVINFISSLFTIDCKDEKLDAFNFSCYALGVMDTYRLNRLKAIKNLGSECVCCGERAEIVLEFDHKNGDGKKDRKDKTFYKVLAKLARGEDLNRFQLLCSNCHTIKSKLARASGRNPSIADIRSARQKFVDKNCFLTILAKTFKPESPTICHEDGTEATTSNPILIERHKS